MKQVTKNVLYEKVGASDIGFEANGAVKSKETRVYNGKRKCHSPMQPFAN